MREANELIVPFSMDEVEQALRSLPNTKASDLDGMHGVFLKKILPFLKHEIMNLFSDYFNTGLDLSDLNYPFLSPFLNCHRLIVWLIFVPLASLILFKSYC